MFIPIDTTPKSGAIQCESMNLSMSHGTDFIVAIDTKANSRMWVQERYCTTDAIYGDLIYAEKSERIQPPQSDSTVFRTINMLLQKDDFYQVDKRTNRQTQIDFGAYDKEIANDYFSITQTYETGKLTYGNANPKAEDFNSLADFCGGDGFVQIKIPWGLLNFADPSHMRIHDDDYEHYGVEYMKIDHMNVGLGDGSNTIEMKPFKLKPRVRNPEYHERLNQSYYILKDYWTLH